MKKESLRFIIVQQRTYLFLIYYVRIFVQKITCMKTATVTGFRDNIKDYLEEIIDNHEELIISRAKNKNVVVLSQEDYNAIRETAYLLSVPANAKRIQESLKQYEKGKTVKKSLKDL